MSKEIPLKLIVGALSNEKGVSEEVIFQAIEAALVSATKKKHEKTAESEIDVRVSIDRKTGQYETFRFWAVVEDDYDFSEVEFLEKRMMLSEAKKYNSKIKVGEIVEEPLESAEFGRIAAQTAKQVIIQKVRDAERAALATEFRSKKGQLLTGIVKRANLNNVFIDLGNNAEALMRREDMLPRESVRPGDRIRAYLYEISTESKGPQLFLSRTHSNMLVELFKIEVPEVGEGIIEIKACAREPGVRAKIAVKTNDGRIDPIGACVGMRGARVQAVSNELGGERVDVILWDDNPAQLVMNAMAPADIVSIVVDEDAHAMDIAVSENQVSQAIGRSGQNVKLASELTGWDLNVISDSEAEAKNNNETHLILETFIRDLGVDEEVATVLMEEGFTSLEEIAYVPIQELTEIEGFDEEIVKALRERAKEVLVSQALKAKVQEESKVSNESLASLKGMDAELVRTLAQQKIVSRDDLAELSIVDLIALHPMTEAKASDLIMAARAHWFTDENK